MGKKINISKAIKKTAKKAVSKISKAVTPSKISWSPYTAFRKIANTGIDIYNQTARSRFAGQPSKIAKTLKHVSNKQVGKPFKKGLGILKSGLGVFGSTMKNLYKHGLNDSNKPKSLPPKDKPIWNPTPNPNPPPKPGPGPRPGPDPSPKPTPKDRNWYQWGEVEDQDKMDTWITKDNFIF